MAQTLPRKSHAEIATIDCCLVTVQTYNGSELSDEFGFDTANQVEVEPQTEEQDAVRLVVKGILRAQKKKKVILVGNQITLHDNVFNPDLAVVLQGGAATYDATTHKLTGYTPPASDSGESGETFVLNVYSAQYDTSGNIIQYEKISYPNCTGQPVSFSAEDDAFRAPEYVIDSAPSANGAPYEITYVTTLPTLNDITYD